MDGNLTYLEGLGEGKVTATSFNQFTSSYTTGSFTGSFKGDGSGLTGIPGATPIDTTIFVTTSSFNSFTSSYISDSSSFDSRITNLSSSINSITGSVTINTGSFVTTSSFNSFTSSYTTGSFTGFFTGDGSQLTAVVFATSSTTASYALSVDFDNIQDVPEGLISSSAQLAGATIPGNFTVEGTLTSRTFESQLISSSIIYESGSTKFGDSIDDTHQFTGSIQVQGSITGSFTGSFVGDGSGLTGIPSGGGPSVYEYTGSFNNSIVPLLGSNVASGSFGTVGGGTQNKANGNCSTVGGGCCNITNARHSIIAGGHRNVIQSPTNECCSSGVTISGGIGHNSTGGTLDFDTLDITGTITCCNAGYASTISGGLRNIATGGTSTVGGGSFNTASGYGTTVGGGCGNTASSYCTTVGGGGYNTASNWYSTVGGGKGNCAPGCVSTVGGGQFNTASGIRSTVSGGCSNTASGYISTVSGGRSNTASGTNSTVSGGYCNTAAGFRSGILGGASNTVRTEDSRSFIIGSGITSNAPLTTFVNNFNVSGSSILSQVSSSLNFVDDAAAAAGGVPLGGLYRSGNFILIRLA